MTEPISACDPVEYQSMARAQRGTEIGPPLLGQPGPFSLGGEGVLAAAFDGAGFKDAQSVMTDAPVRVLTAGECLASELVVAVGTK